MIQYVLLDTNTLIRYVTQGTSGCEPEYFDKLVSFVHAKRVRLFSSEVVALEFAMKSKDVLKDYTTHFEEIKRQTVDAMNFADKYFRPPTETSDSTKKPKENEEKTTDKLVPWNEMGGVQKWLKDESVAFSQKLSAQHDILKQEMGERLAKVEALIESKVVEPLPFDENVMLRTKKRFILKRFLGKRADSKPESDYFIIDSVVRYFEKNTKQPVLLCSENKTDFGAPLKDGTWTLNHFIREDLPSGSALFLSMATLVAFIEAGKPVEDPSPEDFQVALDVENQRAGFCEVWDFQVRELRHLMTQLNRFRNTLVGFDAWADHKLEPIYVHGHAAALATKGKNVKANARTELSACLRHTNNVLKENSIIDERVRKILKPIQSVCSELIDMIDWIEDDPDEEFYYSDDP